jgi:hypothetical protein
MWSPDKIAQLVPGGEGKITVGRRFLVEPGRQVRPLLGSAGERENANSRG